jgi:hypothetical protein
MERRIKQTQFTKREILDIVNDPRYTPYDGGLHYPPELSDRLVREGNLTFGNPDFPGGEALKYEFLDAHTLRWLYHGFEWREEYYEAYEPEENIVFFFHNIKGSTPPSMRSFVVDFNTNRVTVNEAQIGNDDYTPRDTSNRMSFMAIEGRTVSGEPHGYTDDMVGQVIAWQLGGGYWLTHHYINTKFFLNEIGAGPDPFLTIAEPAQYVAIDKAKGLYLFSWREMAGPGIMGWDLMNLKQMRSCGMFYGINEGDRFECYCFTRINGKFLSVEDRKVMCRDGIFVAVNIVGSI